MSRIPQPSSSRLKPPSTPGKSRTLVPTTPTSPSSTASRTRTISNVRSKTPTKPRSAEKPPKETVSAAPPMSIKEAIALKRAEARKAQMNGGDGGGLSDMSGLDDALLHRSSKVQEEEDLLGRMPVRDTIEHARSTGSLNLSTRSLVCLPSALFEIHLGLKSDPLRSVPDEPELPPSEAKPGRRGGEKPAWFEAQDLTVLKAWNNNIQEIQHEISLFGSLKTVDLHKNELASLPNTFADLTSLTTLDLSHNALTSVPEKLYALPELTTLNLSHNKLVSLPFNAPFVDSNGRPRRIQQSSGGFFVPTISHSSTPLPRLVILDVSQNKLTAAAIDDHLPVSLTKVDLSENPLGHSLKLFRNLSSLKRLKEVRMEKCEIGDDSFTSETFPGAPFVALRLLDLSDTQATVDAVKSSVKHIKQELNFDFSTEDPPEGVIRILVGKQVVKEPWELELEKRAKARVTAASSFNDWSDLPPSDPTTVQSTYPSSQLPTKAKTVSTISKPNEIVKEAWELEAEQGLLTEGGKRRARAQAAAAAQKKDASTSPDRATSSVSLTSSNSSSSGGLSSPQYYTLSTQTLKLPPSQAMAKVTGHSRAFSVAAPSSLSSSTAYRTTDLEVPTPTLPLATIVLQPFAQSLRVLILTNRRMDKTFSLPSFDHIGGFLPSLEELDLEGCNLNDVVPVCNASESPPRANTPPRSNEPIIPTLAKLFPSLRTLNLSYNALTNTSITFEALSDLILTSPHRKGLRHLRLRGNRLSDLDSFLGLAESFKGNREFPAWKLEELDVRDNEIAKLSPELGLLPLDVFLVEGNTFRVPQRRVWEREGTKGLLSWLRGRIE